MKKIVMILLLEIAFFIVGCSLEEHPLSKEPEPKKPTFNSNNLKSVQEGVYINLDKSDPNVSKYKIYRSTQRNNGYEEIIVTAETFFIDKNVTEGTTYFYKIAGVSAGGLEGYDSDSAEIQFILVPPSPEIRIIVTDLRHDKPIADATIKIEGEGFSDTAQTDAFGKHTFTLERDGTYKISVDKSGFISSTRDVDSTKENELDISLKPIPKVIRTIANPAHPFRTPAYVVFSPDGNRAYVTNRFGNNVSVIDASTDQVLRTIDVGNEPLGLAINPVKPELYIVNHSDNTISVIDTDTCKLVGEPIKVGRLPTQAVVNSNGAELYVVNSGGNSVSIVKLTGLPHESEKINVGRTPYGIAKSSDNRYLYVTNEADDTISVVSLLTKSVERTIPVGRAPKDVAVGRDGEYALVSNNLSANIAVIELKLSPPKVNMQEVGRLPMGIALISEPDNSQTAYVVLKAEAGVKIFDFVTMQIIDESIIVGTSPVGIAEQPNGDKIYVVNSDENSVTVFGY